MTVRDLEELPDDVQKLVETDGLMQNQLGTPAPELHLEGWRGTPH